VATIPLNFARSSTVPCDDCASARALRASACCSGVAAPRTRASAPVIADCDSLVRITAIRSPSLKEVPSSAFRTSTLPATGEKIFSFLRASVRPVAATVITASPVLIRAILTGTTGGIADSSSSEERCEQPPCSTRGSGPLPAALKPSRLSGPRPRESNTRSGES